MKAITRKLSSSMQDCELTHMTRQTLNLEVARAQHEAYNQKLRELHVEVIELPEQPDLPDSVFVEDAALVFDEVAVITRPGAESRRPETSTIAQALSEYRNLVQIESPAVLDGGDVLTVGQQVHVGLSSRSNSEGVKQLRNYLQPYGYEVHGLVMGECLHLKSAVTALDDNTLLLNSSWVDAAQFASYKIVETHPDEPNGANIVRVGDALLYGEGYPHTQARIEALGFDVHTVDMSELAKAEGAVTCCSLLIAGP